MPSYLVTWEINEEAATPREAAQAAWNRMRAPDSSACVFTVVDEDGEQTPVDLAEGDEDEDEALIASCRAVGWEHGGDGAGFIFHVATWGSWKAAASWENSDNAPTHEGARLRTYASWRDCFDGEELNYRP